MSEPSRPDRQKLARLARQHLDSLRSAGVEWAPGPPTSMSQPDLFGTAGEGEARPVQPVPADPPEQLETRRQALGVLTERVSACTRCAQLAATRTQTVFGVGEPGVELC